MPRIFSYLCIGKGMVEATTWPKTALKTQSMSQVGDLDGKDMMLPPLMIVMIAALLNRSTPEGANRDGGGVSPPIGYVLQYV